MVPLTLPFRRFPETELALVVPLTVPDAVPEMLPPPVLPQIAPPEVVPAIGVEEELPIGTYIVSVFPSSRERLR